MPCCPPFHLEEKLLSNSGQSIPSDSFTTSKSSQHYGDYAIEGSPAPSTVNERFRQVESDPISEDQLVNDVRRIYAQLVIVERWCKKLDELAKSETNLSRLQWQGLLHCHQTLLNMHHDFFSTSQHPSAGAVLKSLAEKYYMPSRMWRFGIHSLLEALRLKLPKSSDYMFEFIYFAYPTITVLLQSVSVFRETWMECLGDLARYGTAIEESDMGDYEVWAAISRDWYMHAADHRPEVGRIQHRLAVLAWPDSLQQLFFYMKALVSVRPYPDAREWITRLFTRFEGEALHPDTILAAFIATHRALFMQASPHEFNSLANHFLALLRRGICELQPQHQQAVYIMSCNIAPVLQYGEPEAVIPLKYFKRYEETGVKKAHDLALESMSGQKRVSNDDAGTLIQSQIAYRGSSLAFHTLSVFLHQRHDPKIFPGVHISLSFIWCLALHPSPMQQLESYIPWIEITSYLNSLFGPDIIASKIEQAAFPLLGDRSIQQLPEDFLIRGQSWSQLYYPDGFFEETPPESDRPMIEKQSAAILRRHRCIWLGVRIATVCRVFLVMHGQQF